MGLIRVIIDQQRRRTGDIAKKDEENRVRLVSWFSYSFLTAVGDLVSFLVSFSIGRGLALLTRGRRKIGVSTMPC